MDTDAIYQNNPNIHTDQPRHKAIAALVEGPRVLDFGCGTGDLLLILQDERPDWQLAGVDKSPTACSLLRGRGFGGLVFCASQPAGLTKYNTIIAAQVLEHIEDDRYVVNNLKDALEPGGLLIVSVPNNGAVQSPDHKRVYTVDSLRELLSVIGEPELQVWTGRKTRIIMTVRKEVDDGA